MDRSNAAVVASAPAPTPAPAAAAPPTAPAATTTTTAATHATGASTGAGAGGSSTGTPPAASPSPTPTRAGARPAKRRRVTDAGDARGDEGGKEGEGGGAGAAHHRHRLPHDHALLVSQVCRFWFGDQDPRDPSFKLRNALWFRGGAEVDGHVASFFKVGMQMAAKGKLRAWATAARVADTRDPDTGTDGGTDSGTDTAGAGAGGGAGGGAGAGGGTGGGTGGGAQFTGGRLAHTHSPLVALVVLLDQLPRNAFRGSHKSFTADPAAIDIVRVRHAQPDRVPRPP